jgi:hypothetical protein
MLPGKGAANETENKVREGLELAVNKREMESWSLRSGRKRPNDEIAKIIPLRCSDSQHLQSCQR